MVTDLRYAIGQLERATAFCVERPARDCIQRAMDALERCLERAEAQEAALEVDDVYDADLVALFADSADASDAYLAKPPTEAEKRAFPGC